MSNNGDNNAGDGNEGKERRIRDMLGLVKFCLETTAKEDASNSSTTVGPMDPDRRAWLQQAINSMSMDTTRLLLENLTLVKETVAQLEADPNYNVPVQKTCNAIEFLTDLCEDIDYASDFAKLSGFSIFKTLIGCKHEDIIVKSCELIAALAQNNPICQTMAMNTRLLERLLDFVDLPDGDTHIKARSYALYSISSIIRSNQEVRTHFESLLDGLSVLLRLLSFQQLDSMLDNKKEEELNLNTSIDESKSSSVYWWRKLRIRSIFLFRTLCAESPSASKYFFEKQAIKIVANQLENLHDSEIREHLLQALSAFLLSLKPPKQTEALQAAPELRKTVQIIHDSSTQQQSSDDYDLGETRSTCKELLNLFDSLQSS